MFKKGDVVKINATVKSVPVYYQAGTHKDIRRYINKLQLTGIILGYSFLKTGKVIEGKYYDEPNSLQVEKSYKVYVVEPFEQYAPYSPNGERLIKSNRYLEPIRCFEDDIELLV